MTENAAFLFVYGTLQPSFTNEFAQYLRRHCTCLGEGSFPGLLFDLGTYPGAIYQKSSPLTVLGTIYRIDLDKQKLLTYLDEYEGITDPPAPDNEYIRTIIPVMHNQTTIHCWVYLYNYSTGDKPIIPSGDYSRYSNQPKPKE